MMSEKQAKKKLRQMLRFYTAGSVLHLLSDLYRASAQKAERAGDRQVSEQCRLVEATLVVVGMGIDTACPR
jgi:hypothetical protein